MYYKYSFSMLRNGSNGWQYNVLIFHSGLFGNTDLLSPSASIYPELMSDFAYGFLSHRAGPFTAIL